MESKTIQKYSKRSVPWLRKKAQEIFNAFIRNRDAGLPCISCGNPNPNQAGHYYSAGHYPGLALDEDNVHRQCLQCNYHQHGNLIKYRNGLLKRIGFERLEGLDMRADRLKRNGYKHDRFTLIDIIEKYRNKLKEQIL